MPQAEMKTRPGYLGLDEARSAAAAGEIETVLIGFVDMQGRLQGKECGAGHFLNVVADHGSHACNYLLSVDVEMEPQDGFETSGWSTGHGDFELVPDIGSLRKAAWRPRTAICIADATTLQGEAVEPAPRAILKRQLDRLGDRGWSALVATELEFILHRENYREAFTRDYANLTPVTYYNSDYSLLGMRHAGAFLDRVKRDSAASGFDLETAKGEANQGQCEVNFRYGEAIEAADSHAIFKHLVKEIALEEDVSATFMAKWDEREGNSCHVHLSLRDESGSLFDRDTQTFRRFIAGQLACMKEFTLLFAPNLNSYKRFAERSFAPTGIAWGNDNRSCAVRVIGTGPSLRMEHRLPGADVNPYLALAAVVAAGLHGIDEELELRPPEEGDAYTSDAPRVPGDIATAISSFADSECARTAFGPQVVAHYVRGAEVERDAFAGSVTDWERRRGYERL